MKRKIKISRLLVLLIPFLILFGVLTYAFYPKEVQSKQKELEQNTYTLSDFLQIAIQPCGHTMYVWGGGWNEEDTGAGKEAVTIGESKNWKNFYELQDASYNYQDTTYQIHDGLDCSGYVGWAVYNLINTQNNKDGLVMDASLMAKEFANMHLGTYTDRSHVSTHHPGDIMSTNGHVYIVLGQCEDGSVLLIHASPPGVRICGTVDENGNIDSQAYQLAKDTMETYYPEWCSRYPDYTANIDYLTLYDQFTWNIDDPQGVQSMSASEVIQYLFN